MLTPDEFRAIERNLFRAARHVLRDRADFPWHRDRTRTITADRPWSSQALAVDVFGTLQTLQHLDVVLDAWQPAIGIGASVPWQGHPRLVPGSTNQVVLAGSGVSQPSPTLLAWYGKPPAQGRIGFPL